MSRIQSLIRTARTPMTSDEVGAIKRSARMGVYAILHVIAFLVWCAVSLWITMWAAVIVVPNFGRLIQDGLGVTSENASSTEAFINYWAAPLALVVIVLAVGAVALCMLVWRVRARVMRAVRRWVDRAVPAQDESDAESAKKNTTTTSNTRSRRARQKKQA